MNRIFRIFSLALVLAAASVTGAHAQQKPAAQAKAQAQPAELTPVQFKEAVEAGNCQLIDVRTPAEFKTGHLKGAVNIDWAAADYEALFDRIPKDRPVLLYCLGGARSEQAREYLAAKGYAVQHMAGGISAWRKAGLPVEQ